MFLSLFKTLHSNIFNCMYNTMFEKKRKKKARSAVNREVGGSSQPSDEFVLLFLFISIFNTLKK